MYINLKKLKASVLGLAVADETSYLRRHTLSSVTTESGKATYKEESQVEISKRRPCEEELDCIVYKFNLRTRQIVYWGK